MKRGAAMTPQLDKAIQELIKSRELDLIVFGGVDSEAATSLIARTINIVALAVRDAAADLCISGCDSKRPYDPNACHESDESAIREMDLLALISALARKKEVDSEN
jgi:hypothetical protein